MADVQLENSTIDTNTANNMFYVIWRCTRAMKQAGWTVMASSTGLVKDTSGVAANDKWGGNATPSADTYPTAFDTQNAWIVLERTSMIQIPLTTNATGVFVRGEQVTQTGSGATGEVYGIVFDTVGSNGGWMNIIPRTGTFDNTTGSRVITGAISGATCTPSATPKVFKQSIMFCKNTNVGSGTAYYICADASAESTQLFSYIATAASVSVGPGMGTSLNAFPAKGIVLCGTSGSTTGGSWFGTSVSNNTTHCQVVAINATASAGVSPDASFWVAVPASTAGNPFYHFAFHRLDHGEPGDTDPYAWYWQQSTSYSSFSATAPSNGFVSQAALIWGDVFFSGGVAWVGYIARGTGFTTDVAGAFLASVEFWGSNANPDLIANTASTVQEQNHPGTIKPMVQTDIGLVNSITNKQMKKGRPRWLRLLPLGTQLNTFSSKQWFVLISQNGTTSPAVVIGPLDGTTTPIV